MSRQIGYRSIEEFNREELRSSFKIGYSLDDLLHEASLNQERHNLFDEQEDERDE